MYQIFDVSSFIVRITACVHYLYFCHQNKTLKKLSKTILFPKNALFILKISKVLYLPLPLFFPLLIIADFIEEVD